MIAKEIKRVIIIWRVDFEGLLCEMQRKTGDGKS
jgi:hypothetical protein